MSFACWRFAAVALIAAPGLAQAQEGSGCGGFKWPLDRERAALTHADKPSIPNGGALAYEVAATLELQPLSRRGVAKGARAGAEVALGLRWPFRLAAPAKPGVYRVTISRRAGSTCSTAARSCTSIAFTPRRGAKACARASSSTCRPARSRSNSAASRAIKSPLSFRPTNSRPIRWSFRQSRFASEDLPPRRRRTHPSMPEMPIPVKTIATSASSATAITSASRTDPPGWMTAVAPASIVAIKAVGKRKERVGGDDRAPRARLGQARHLGGLLGLARGETRGIDPRHLARADPTVAPSLA